jgi:predicted transcriptional regulator
MRIQQLTETEERFAELIWANEPISSGDLVKLSEEKMGWKKSTMYTVLKNLGEKGIFQNKNALVSSLITREQYHANVSRRFVEENFGGSLPLFLTAFISGKKLSERQVEELKRLIDSHKEA